MSGDVWETLRQGQALSRQQAAYLLGLENQSEEYYALLHAANRCARAAFGGRGLVFGQVGLDAQKCSINCKFCALAKDNFCLPPTQKSQGEVLALAQELVQSGIEDLFLMSTAEYPKALFLEMGRAVSARLPEHMRLVANTGDFDLAYAKELKKAGFTGVYHICRLREGQDTGANLSQRLRTMDAVKQAGLMLYYCVEPIGPEHSTEELLEEIFRPLEYPVEVMAVMKRIGVPGTPLAAKGELNAVELAKICAVATLAVRPSRAMCVHEPDALCLLAGANQLYAECGTNPRDTAANTQDGRGMPVPSAWKMLQNAGWERPHMGP